MEIAKVYIYTRVSTAMQIDGYSLEAQKNRIKAFAEYSQFNIVHEYEDAGKSGKSIDGRIQFQTMLNDIVTGKDKVSFVLVYKLSRFGRNAADVLSTLQIMQDYGVNLICVEDGIDSSKDAGKLMISVLSAVAEIERENIRIQTMEGRIQKARDGKWNGGFAPYGYKIVDGVLEINEEEAEAIRMIFDLYANTDMGANGVAKHLENHGIRKIARQNGKYPLFTPHLIRSIINNPVYNGKIAYGRRKTEKVHGTRNEYKQVKSDEYLLVDGLHEALVDEELWRRTQLKIASQAKKYEVVDRIKNQQRHLLSGIVKCPICGTGMYGNKAIKRKKDGSKYKDFYYYGCKRRKFVNGEKCTYNKQINENVLNGAVIEIVSKAINNSKLLSIMKGKINTKIDTSEIDLEISNYEKQLRQFQLLKNNLIGEIDMLDPEAKHYIVIKNDLNERLYSMYDKIEDVRELLNEASARKKTIEEEKLTSDNIYEILMHFDKLYSKMSNDEQRKFIELIIEEIQIYEERQQNGQWIKSIEFKLPIIEESFSVGLDKNTQVETVVLLSHKKPDSHINVKVEFGEGEGKVPLKAISERAEAYKPKERVTYKMIKEYIEAKYGFKVHTAYIAEVKRDLGLPMYDAPNAVEELKQPRKHPTPEKVEAIKDALKYFEVI
ncbi:recombinase family protein [Thomasclavelia ramosa]|uniref:recombinase family protein n=1 Tax=Thomasclavelia ramosa TaxID=1547 RepID=UPI003DA29D85